MERPCAQIGITILLEKKVVRECSRIAHHWRCRITGFAAWKKEKCRYTNGKKIFHHRLTKKNTKVKFRKTEAFMPSKIPIHKPMMSPTIIFRSNFLFLCRKKNNFFCLWFLLPKYLRHLHQVKWGQGGVFRIGDRYKKTEGRLYSRKNIKAYLKVCRKPNPLRHSLS